MRIFEIAPQPRPDKIFYHGSYGTGHIKKILKNGLKPGDNNTFMSTDLNAPNWAATGGAPWIPDDIASKKMDGVIFAIRAPRTQVIVKRMNDAPDDEHIIDPRYPYYRSSDTYNSKGKFAIQRDRGEFYSVVRTGGVPPEMIDRDKSYVVTTDGDEIPLNDWIRQHNITEMTNVKYCKCGHPVAGHNENGCINCGPLCKSTWPEHEEDNFDGGIEQDFFSRPSGSI